MAERGRGERKEREREGDRGEGGREGGREGRREGDNVYLSCVYTLIIGEQKSQQLHICKLS